MLTAGHRLAVLSNGALKFSRVTLGDAGSYQCLAKNEAGVAVGRTKLILHGNVGLKLKDGTNNFLLRLFSKGSILDIYGLIYILFLMFPSAPRAERASGGVRRSTGPAGRSGVRGRRAAPTSSHLAQGKEACGRRSSHAHLCQRNLGHLVCPAE